MQGWMPTQEPRPQGSGAPASHAVRRTPLDAGAAAPYRHGPVAARPPMMPSLVARLTPFDGLELLVQMADATELLTPQIAAPARLQSSHRLPCKADVFATRPNVPWEAILAAVVADIERTVPVTPLTPALAGRLGLEPYLRAPQPVVCLTLIEDPTAAVEDVVPVEVPRSRRPPPPDTARSRKQAVRAARRARRWRRSLFGRLGAWWRRGRTRKERRRWFARLANRPLQAQLWSVRPTASLLLDPRCRRWVRDALAMTGRDRSVTDWEIHWRRRGV